MASCGVRETGPGSCAHHGHGRQTEKAGRQRRGGWRRRLSRRTDKTSRAVKRKEEVGGCADNREGEGGCVWTIGQGDRAAHATKFALL